MQIEEVDNEGRLRHLDVYGKLDVEGLEDLLECVVVHFCVDFFV